MRLLVVMYVLKWVFYIIKAVRIMSISSILSHLGIIFDQFEDNKLFENWSPLQAFNPILRGVGPQNLVRVLGQVGGLASIRLLI